MRVARVSQDFAPTSPNLYGKAQAAYCCPVGAENAREALDGLSPSSDLQLAAS